MNAKQQFAEGDLSAALQAALEEVRSAPTDTAKRWFLCEMLCFEAAWERADKQLETIAGQESSSEVQMSVTLFRQLIRAATARDEVFDQGRAPGFIAGPASRLEDHLRALVALRENDRAGANEILRAIDDAIPAMRGHCDGKPFDQLRDLDDVTSYFFEILTGGGEYVWLAFDQVAKLEFHETQRARDWLWRPAHVELQSGEPLEVFVPAVYPSASSSQDDELKLGRTADWDEEQEGPVRGLGGRMYLVDDEALPIQEISEVQFEHHG